MKERCTFILNLLYDNFLSLPFICFSCHAAYTVCGLIQHFIIEMITDDDLIICRTKSMKWLQRVQYPHIKNQYEDFCSIKLFMETYFSYRSWLLCVCLFSCILETLQAKKWCVVFFFFFNVWSKEKNCRQHRLCSRRDKEEEEEERKANYRILNFIKTQSKICPHCLIDRWSLETETTFLKKGKLVDYNHSIYCVCSCWELLRMLIIKPLKWNMFVCQDGCV